MKHPHLLKVIALGIFSVCVTAYASLSNAFSSSSSAQPTQTNALTLNTQTDDTLNQSLNQLFKQGDNSQNAKQRLLNDGFVQTQFNPNVKRNNDVQQFYNFEKTIRKPLMETKIHVAIWEKNGKLVEIKGFRTLTGL